LASSPRRRRDPPSQATADRQERVDKFLTTALKLFAERDYAAVRMQDIGRVCRVNHSLIYYYFPNKLALFNAAIEHLIANTHGRYQRLAERHFDDPVALLNDWIDTNIELAPALRQLVRVLFEYSGPRDRSVSVDAAIRRFYAQERHIIASGIRQGMKLGLFQRVDADELAGIVSTQIDGIFFGSMMRPDVNFREQMEKLRALLWQLLGHAPGRDARAPRRPAARS
jgi:AcrR family transcriptional regulator